MSLDLAHLKRVAEAADNGSPWEWEHAYPQRITRVGDVVLVADCFEDPDSPSRFAEFIATFDPPTVLAILAALTELEQVTDGYARALLTMTQKKQAAEAERDELRAALVLIGDRLPSDDDSYDGTANPVIRAIVNAALTESEPDT